jgi:Ran GTPase-activating protein (RanGAP) involved in mRNA processing and transport
VDGGLAEFAPLLLVKLDLSSNALGDASAVQLARLIGREGGTLQSVGLAENRIGDEGGMALGRALGTAASLRRLGLSGNPLGERAGPAIVEGLDGSSVVSLGLEATEVPYACVVAANRLLALNQRRWEEAKPRRFEHRRRELQATAAELDAARLALADRRAEVEAQERRLDRLIMQLAIVTEKAEARKAAERDRCAPCGGEAVQVGASKRRRGLVERARGGQGAKRLGFIVARILTPLYLPPPG